MGTSPSPGVVVRDQGKHGRAGAGSWEAETWLSKDRGHTDPWTSKSRLSFPNNTFHLPCAQCLMPACM